MFQYVEDKEFVSHMRYFCGSLMQELCHTLKEEFDIGANFNLIGSGAKNLILQNASEPIDLDYNLEILRCNDFEDCREIKECVRKAFDMVLKDNNFPACQDSTSVLTTRPFYFSEGNPTEFSIDIGIVAKNDSGLHRLIHRKTGIMQDDNYYWNLAPSSKDVSKKAEYIKSKGS